MLKSKKSLVIGVAILAMMALVAFPAGAQGFVHGIEIDVDGEAYYMAGMPTRNGATDIPGHYWVNAGPNQVVGKHYNEGPWPNLWSSDAPEGELLFMVHGIIDTWSPEKAEAYAEMGYVHRHELLSAADGQRHPSKVVWLKHTARTSFTLDGGPHPPHDPPAITPGVAYNFMPNWSMPYVP